jgi:3-methylfumaryl-CoA hydratase
MNLDTTTKDPANRSKPVARTESCSVAVVRRVAAMLDIDPDTVREGDPLPRGWQFVLLAADTRRSALRADGFPGLGVPMPDLGLPRLMLGGRTVSYAKEIPIGATLQRTSCLQNLSRKTTAAGPMAVATLLHELRLARDATPALVETQTYLLLPARKGAADAGAAARIETSATERTAFFTPDETLLFQYSALGFNSHRIHIDRSHARNVEGFPDLVVNGGLVTLLLTEFLRREVGQVPAALKVRHVAPLYCGRAITMTADREGAKWRLKAYDDKNVLAVDMEVEIQ